MLKMLVLMIHNLTFNAVADLGGGAIRPWPPFEAMAGLAIVILYVDIINLFLLL